MPRKWKTALEADLAKAKTKQEKERVLTEAAQELKKAAEANNVDVSVLRASWG